MMFTVDVQSSLPLKYIWHKVSTRTNSDMNEKLVKSVVCLNEMMRVHSQLETLQSSIVSRILVLWVVQLLLTPSQLNQPSQVLHGDSSTIDYQYYCVGDWLTKVRQSFADSLTLRINSLEMFELIIQVWPLRFGSIQNRVPPQNRCWMQTVSECESRHPSTHPHHSPQQYKK
jgi:hypothetical protein